jgi:hypothetical protein
MYTYAYTDRQIGIQILKLHACVCVYVCVCVCVCVCKSRVGLRRGYEGPEGEKKYRSALSLTLPLYGGGWSTPRNAPAALPVGKKPGTNRIDS